MAKITEAEIEYNKKRYRLPVNANSKGKWSITVKEPIGSLLGTDMIEGDSMQAVQQELKRLWTEYQATATTSQRIIYLDIDVGKNQHSYRDPIKFEVDGGVFDISTKPSGAESVETPWDTSIPKELMASANDVRNQWHPENSRVDYTVLRERNLHFLMSIGVGLQEYFKDKSVQEILDTPDLPEVLLDWIVNFQIQNIVEEE